MIRLALILLLLVGCAQPVSVTPPPSEPPAPPTDREYRCRVLVCWGGWTNAALDERIKVTEEIYAAIGARFTVVEFSYTQRDDFAYVEDWDLDAMLRMTSDSPDTVAVFVRDINVILDMVGPPVSYGGLGYKQPAKLLICAWSSCSTVLAHEYGHNLCLPHYPTAGENNVMHVADGCSRGSRFSVLQRIDMTACKRDSASRRVEKPFVCQ